MHGIDLSSWQSLLSTLIGLALFTLIGIGIRLLIMFTIQQRRERLNRQINERLRTLIAAYKVLGGSFTGNLAVDPRHLGDLRRRALSVHDADARRAPEDDPLDATLGSERGRRIRDAVEAALSDVILLGTEDHVRLAERMARDLVAGRPVHTHELVVALRSFIRGALDIGPMPSGVEIPNQGPTRPSCARGREDGGAQRAGRQGGGAAGGMAGGAMGGGMGAGAGLLIGGAGLGADDATDAASDVDAAGR